MGRASQAAPRRDRDAVRGCAQPAAAGAARRVAGARVHTATQRPRRRPKEEQRDDGRLGARGAGGPRRSRGGPSGKNRARVGSLPGASVTPGGCSDCSGRTALARGCHSCPGPHRLLPWALGVWGRRPQLDWQEGVSSQTDVLWAYSCPGAAFVWTYLPLDEGDKGSDVCPWAPATSGVGSRRNPRPSFGAGGRGRPGGGGWSPGVAQFNPAGQN